MTPASLVMMIFVLTLVWGGLALLLSVALKKEFRKSRDLKAGGAG